MMPKQMPIDKGFENSLKFFRGGYNYISNRSQFYESDVYETTFLQQKTVCMIGEEAAKLFYDEDKIKRQGAMPKTFQKTLTGEDGVQTLDDEEHRNRKQYFLNLMTEERIREWGDILKKHLRHDSKSWETKEAINFYKETKRVLTKAVCEWAGVPLSDEEVNRRADRLADLFETSTDFGLGFFKGAISRNKETDLAEELIEEVRNGELNPEPETALYQIAHHRNLDGELLELHPAATDLLNVIRPSVAIAIYFTFVALSLHQFPEVKATLRGKAIDDPYYENFVQEIRRFYPFFPFNAGRVRKDFVWRDYLFEKETLIIFDYYGTCHDERLFNKPQEFNPSRFDEWETSPTDQAQFKLVAQGGGDYLKGHRCPGEWNVVLALKVLTHFLVNDIDYQLPQQDLTYSMLEMPTIPESGIVMENIQLKF